VKPARVSEESALSAATGPAHRANLYSKETTPAMEDHPIEAVRRVSGRQPRKAAGSLGVLEHAKRRKQARILKAFGTVNFDPTCDYKAERRRKRS
jgi:hypothetical protein